MTTTYKVCRGVGTVCSGRARDEVGTDDEIFNINWNRKAFPVLQRRVGTFSLNDGSCDGKIPIVQRSRWLTAIQSLKPLGVWI